MKLLFICNQNQNRSKTAELLFKDRYETKSAGLFNEHPVKESDLEWVDLIFVMEDFQRTELSKRFPKQYLKKKILSLNIPDTYYYNQESLKDILDERLTVAIHQIFSASERFQLSSQNINQSYRLFQCYIYCRTYHR